MNYNEEELRDVFDSFGIRLNRIEQRESYSMPEMYTIGGYDYTNSTMAYRYSEPVFQVELGRDFVYMLIDYYKFVTERTRLINRDPNLAEYLRPSGREFITYVSYLLEQEKKEKELQEKYPELKEIMRDYEVTKALIVNDDKKS